MVITLISSKLAIFREPTKHFGPEYLRNHLLVYALHNQSTFFRHPYPPASPPRRVTARLPTRPRISKNGEKIGHSLLFSPRLHLRGDIFVKNKQKAYNFVINSEWRLFRYLPKPAYPVQHTAYEC